MQGTEGKNRNVLLKATYRICEAVEWCLKMALD